MYKNNSAYKFKYIFLTQLNITLQMLISSYFIICGLFFLTIMRNTDQEQIMHRTNHYINGIADPGHDNNYYHRIALGYHRYMSLSTSILYYYNYYYMIVISTSSIFTPDYYHVSHILS